MAFLYQRGIKTRGMGNYIGMSPHCIPPPFHDWLLDEMVKNVNSPSTRKSRFINTGRVTCVRGALTMLQFSCRKMERGDCDGSFSRKNNFGRFYIGLNS